MKNKFSYTKSTMATFLTAELARNGIKAAPENVESVISVIVDSFANTAPTVPGDDNAPEETEYPDRATLKPKPEEVPDASETEGTDEKKAGVPDYAPMKRFKDAVTGLTGQADRLFSLSADQNRFAKSDARSDAFDWLNEVRSSIYDL